MYNQDFAASQHNSSDWSGAPKNNSWWADNGHKVMWDESPKANYLNWAHGDHMNTKEVIGISIKIDGKAKKLTEIKMIIYNKENIR